jgi:ubiquinone/menaquinone biosynthesis C-methylase UbiE
MNWIILVIVLVVVGFLLDREIYFYEGTHLGPRLQAWLYDRWSKNYDAGKRASQLQDDEMLARPLVEALSEVPEPFILDFATGTGRLSYAILRRTEFKGHMIALDLSQGMLEQAAAKLRAASTAPRIELLRHPALPLPFPDAAFDAVCALEVLELFPGMDQPLAELTRVLRPGGILLTSRGTEESGRKAKVKSTEEMIAVLEKNGLDRIQITKWWNLFDRVIATKHGSSSPAGLKSLASVLRCPSCDHTHWALTPRLWRCEECGKELSVTREGIVLG